MLIYILNFMPVFTVCFFIREQESIPVGGCVSREMGGKYPGGVHTQTPLLDPEADTPPDSKVDTPLNPEAHSQTQGQIPH